MKKHTGTASGISALQRQAENRLHRKPANGARPKPSADMNRLIQELQVHQIELELQNEELKQAKAEGEAALDKYTDLYEFAPVGYFNLNPDGRILLVNLTGASLTGANRSNLVGRSFASLVSAELRPAFKTFLKQVFTAHDKQSSEFELDGPGQSSRAVSVEAQRLPSGLECRAVMMDITDRKRIAANLRVSEIRYRRLFEAAHDGVLLLDPVTRKITDANPFMTTLLGYPRDQLIGKELFQIGLLKDEGASQEMFTRLKRNHEVRYEDLPLESKEGRHQEVEVVANVYDEDGHAVIQCNIRDITKRKQAEDILRRNEALFSALVQQAPVGVYVVDARFQMQQVNPKARPVFKSVRPLIGRDFSEILRVIWSPPVAKQIALRFRKTLDTGEPYQSPDFTARRRDTAVVEIYEWQIQRVTLPAGEFGVVCFFNNITERKRAESAQRRLDVLAASNAKLRQEIVRRGAVETALKKSEQRAHQLLEQARQLQRKLRDVSYQNLQAQENQRKEISRELHDEISQLLLGINLHLGIFAKAAAVNPQNIRRTIAPVCRLVEKSVRVVHEFARELRPAMLDDLGLIPALHSYIANFPKRKGRQIHFSAFAGVEALDNDRRTVLYRVAQEALTNVAKHARASIVHVLILKARNGVCLEITDNGKAFDVERLSSPRWSQRLGLIGMRERVEMAGGRFSVKSVRGTGTTVRAELPFGQGPIRT